MQSEKPGSPSNAAQIASASYRLAALDQDYLLGDSMRGVRFLLECSGAEEALRTDGRQRDNVIATGGGPGIMAAANRGATEAGAPSIGFNITLPQEQDPNPYTTPELTFRFHYFAMRKMRLAMRANALVVFPGGFGTLNELFEILTLQQTRKAPRIPTVVVDRDYWSSVIDFEALVAHGMAEVADLALFRYADDAEQAWAHLQVSRAINGAGRAAAE